jgi:hypothetical protein
MCKSPGLINPPLIITHHSSLVFLLLNLEGHVAIRVFFIVVIGTVLPERFRLSDAEKAP